MPLDAQAGLWRWASRTQATDGSTRRVYEKGDVVEYTRSKDGKTYTAMVAQVLPLSPEMLGLPAGYVVKIDDTGEYVDTVAKRLRPAGA